MAKILVVENDLGNAEVIEMILTYRDHDVITIQQTDKLAITVAQFLPELIIMDIILENQDGRILCNELKMQEHTSHIPIMLITAMTESQARSIKCYADHLMLKPFDCDVLTTEINSMLYKTI